MYLACPHFLPFALQQKAFALSAKVLALRQKASALPTKALGVFLAWHLFHGTFSTGNKNASEQLKKLENRLHSFFYYPFGCWAGILNINVKQKRRIK